MAHGFLTPTPVSGDNFWKNVEWLWKKLNKEKEEKEEKEKGGGLATTQKSDIIDENVKAVRVTDVSTPKAQRNPPPVAKMLKQSAVAGALNAGTDAIVKKEQLALPPGGPRLPGSAEPSKGGTFTNIPGIAAAPKKLDSEAFFKAAQTGVHPETGKYLSSQERKDYLKKSKAQMNAPASVASAAAAPAIDSSSTVTKGDEQIVGSIDNLTKVTSSLVAVVKAQTATQKQTAAAASAKAETIANRAKATEEEKALEQGTDNSGFITPTGGVDLTKLGGNQAGGGGAGGGPGLGFGGKVAANAIAKRGVGRMATRAGAHFAGKQGAKMGAKAAGKLGLKTLGIAGKKIPFFGLGLGGLFAAGRALKGDWAGAGMELASGAASTIPGFGTAASLGIDAALMAKDAASGDFAAGGLVTGGKKSVVDDVKINADEGEVVMSNAAGNTFGRGTLLAMNAMGGGANKPTGGKGYAEGGLVGGDKAKSKQMFKLFGEGMIDAQKQNSREYAKIQSAGMRQYYENEGGGEKLGKSLASVWGKISGVLGGLFSGTLNSLIGPANAATGNPADYLTGPPDFSGSSGQAQAMNYFMSQGLTQDQAAGIVGNLMQESGAGIDPNAKNGSGHRGIAQWDKNRWGNFEKFAKNKGLDVNTREAQLQWIMEEMRTGAGGLSLKTLKGAKTSRQAAELFLKQYERSGEEAGSAGFENRMKNAAKLANLQIATLGGSAGGGGTGGSKLENDILAFRQARTKFGVSGNRVATGASFNLAIRELRGAKGGTSINPLADDTSYEDVHRSQAHKQGYGFDVPVSGREQANFVIQFFRSRGYQTIHGRAEDPSGGHDHHVHVQAPDSKAKEFMASVKPKPKPKPAQGTGTAAQTGARTKADLMGSATQPTPSGQELAQLSTEDAVSQRRRTKSDTVGNTTIINNNNGSSSPRGNSAPAGTSARSQGLDFIALARR